MIILLKDVTDTVVNILDVIRDKQLRERGTS